MGIMVNFGGELIRFNPSNGKIEYSTTQGRSWIQRNSGSTLGNVKSLIVYGDELLLCSDKGVFYSTTAGRSWIRRSAQQTNFIDLQDCGKEILATTGDGHLYYSTTAGRSWVKRR